MDRQLVLQGLIEIGLSLFTALFIFFCSFRLFSFMTKNINELDELKKNNIAIAILAAAFILGIMLMIKSAVGPALDTLGNSMANNHAAGSETGYSIIRIVIIYFGAAVFAFIILWIAIKLFMLLTTDIDEMREIKNNNTSISLVLAVLIMGMSIIFLNPLTTLLSGLVTPPAINANMKQPLFNLPVIIEGSIELIITFIFSLLIFYVSFKVFGLLTKKIDEVAEIKANNMAIAVLISAFIFSMILLIKSSIDPANETLKFALNQNAGIIALLLAILRIIVFFILASIFSFIILWLSIKSFTLLTTNIDEIAQIKNKNVAIAIILAILILSSALLLSHGLSTLLNGLVPKPPVGTGLFKLPIQ